MLLKVTPEGVLEAETTADDWEATLLTPVLRELTPVAMVFETAGTDDSLTGTTLVPEGLVNETEAEVPGVMVAATELADSTLDAEDGNPAAELVVSTPAAVVVEVPCW